MKKWIVFVAVTVFLCGALSFGAAASGADGSAPVINPSAEPLTQEETRGMVQETAEAFYQDGELREELESEIRFLHEEIPTDYYPAREWDFCVLTHKGKSMRFFMETIGEPNENGRYPLYITLHGGGGAPAEVNNDQWIDMFYYYRDAVENGIYVACRGIEDVWNLHFLDDSYMLYDRLIEAMAVLYGADPGRVYLLGFSAGGDGVYQVAPRLADRFAAVSMSSGHPNGVSLLNLANCPICLQTGIRDYYSEDAMRSVRTAEFDRTLSGYHDKYGFGYPHSVWIHVPEGHNYVDYEDSESLVLKDPAAFAARAAGEDMPGVLLDVLEACGLGRDIVTLSYYIVYDSAEFDKGILKAVTETLGLETVSANTNAVRYVSRFTRDPAPAKIVWDLSTRAPSRENSSFYWLEAGPSVSRGIITAEFDTAANTLTVEPDADVDGDFSILFHPSLVDVSRPVTIRTGGTTLTVRINPSAEFLKASMYEKGDPELACIGKIEYSAIISAGRAE